MAIKTGLEGKPWWHGLVAGVVGGGLFLGLMYLWQLKPMRLQIEGLEADLKAKQQRLTDGPDSDLPWQSANLSRGLARAALDTTFGPVEGG